MRTRIKNYSKTAYIYANKLRKRGYAVLFNWIDEGQYEDITIIGYGEFSTPVEAWKALVTKKM